MPERIPETNKKTGVCYAWTDENSTSLPCLELPVIDITHPAFAFAITPEELDKIIDGMVASTQRLASLPPAVLQGILQQSLLMRGLIVDSANTFTTGVMTYLNKLGPDNLGSGYASPLDRQWAASLTPLTFRWRMRDVARLLADGLAPLVAARPGRPLRLVNIAGGPAADSLNALILLQKEQPALLAGREISLNVLDLDREGPLFARRALAALQAPGGPLSGLAAQFESIVYDWSDPTRLARLVSGFEPGVVAGGSSEGGLFEYASDEDIIANLAALRDAAPPDFILVGPVVRSSDTLDARLKATEHVPGRPAVRYLGLEKFSRLADSAGWQIVRSLDGPMHQVVELKIK